MIGDGGPSALMYLLRGRALEAQRGDSPDLSVIYAPGTLREARRRLVATWLLSVSWIPALFLGGIAVIVGLTTAFLGFVLAASTQFEAAWIGSPIRRWTRPALAVAALGVVAVFFLG